MNDKEFFNKIGCDYRPIPQSIKYCAKCEWDKPMNNESEFTYPKITADHIIALEGLIDWPYAFRLRRDTYLGDAVKYVLHNCKTYRNIYETQEEPRKEALKSLISWMIDENILTKDEVKAVFE